MENVGCNLCGNTGWKWRSTYRDHSDWSVLYHLVKCSECDLVYLNPRPGHADVLACSRIYQDLLRDMRQKLQRSRLGRLGIRLMRRARTPERTTPDAKILDIGCATGEYLAYLRSAGWNVAGIEMDPDSADYARGTFGLNVMTGSAETVLAGLPSRQFDVVTMWHVLEHLDDARTVLLNVRRVLKPSGKLLLEVPNFGSVWRSLLRENWFPIEYPYHRYHFTPRTLRRLLTSAGFEVRRIAGQPAPAETVWSFQMLGNRITRSMWDGRLVWSPFCVVTLYPIDMLLAPFCLTNHMQAVAVPDVSR